MEKSLKQLKHIERISRQTRHHRTFLNQIYDQKLHQELIHLNDQYQQNFIRSKTQQKIERQRKEVLDITIQQIAHEKQHQPLTILSKNNLDNHSLSTPRTSCRLFSHKCQLYPSPIITRSSPPIQQSQQNRSQFSITLRNQYHLANRHVFMQRTKERLDEQSRLLHGRLADKKNFDYPRGHKHQLKQAIQRHLENSAKFCA